MLVEKDKYIALETKKEITRSVSNPVTENVIRGPLDAFNENIETNIGLIRKRLKRRDLYLNEFNIGSTKNTVGIMYRDGVCDENII